MALGTGGAASPVSRHERYRATRTHMRRFQTIARALGVDEEALRRASVLLDDQAADAEVFLQVLAEMVEERDKC